ncbi:Arm DNA-binding domain-containing protein [Xanthobacter autotrophicus]|uniref:Arm DNA-binding domain-containing protein n=1 Tax=Xanthobacter autotrophicus TaxID=280 RepID=UPI0037261E7B
MVKLTKVVASGLKTFVVQYRNAQGRSRRILIGRYGVMTLEEARREAKTVLGRIARGVDPLEEKQAAASDAITVAEVCDWYLAEAEAGRILGKRRRPIKASTLAMDRSRIDVHIRPLLGKRAVSALKLGDIEGAQADIAAGKTSKPRDGRRGRRCTDHVDSARHLRARCPAGQDREQPGAGRASPRQHAARPPAESR